MLVAVIPYFNPLRCPTLTRNFEQTVQTWKDRCDIPLFPVEVVYRNRKPEFTRRVASMQFQTNTMVWQKEAIINAAVKKLPQDVTRILVVDADIVWGNYIGLKDAVNAGLDKHAFVQPWRYMDRLNPDGTTESRVTCRTQDRNSNGYFGAMAFHRQFFQWVGLYDKLIVGPNDVAWFHASEKANHPYLHALIKRMNPRLEQHLLEWSNKCFSYARGQMGYVDRNISHLWHGSNDLDYNERFRWLKDFDPETDLEYNKQGLLEWTKIGFAKKDMVEGVETMFKGFRDRSAQRGSETPVTIAAAAPASTKAEVFRTGVHTSLGKPKVAVVTCHFNPLNGKNLKANLREFLNHMKETDAKVFMSELCYPGGEFEVKQSEAGLSSTRLHGTHEEHMLWQKERMLNIVLPSVPPEYDAIAWLDADILFHDHDWKSKLEFNLSNNMVSQCFYRAWQRYPDGSKSQMEKPSCGSGYTRRQEYTKLDRFHPGFAWACRREVLDKTGGFLDTMITGGGDGLMFYGFSGSYNPSIMNKLSTEWAQRIYAWGEKAAQMVQGRIGHLTIDLTHMWHGTRANRRYLERWRWLQEARFDPLVDLQKDQNGLWIWTDHAKETKADMVKNAADYFRMRDEDNDRIDAGAHLLPGGADPTKLKSGM